MNTSLATRSAGQTPSAKWPTGNTKFSLFLEKFDPFRQLCWRAEGGWRAAKTLEYLHSFGPSPMGWLGGMTLAVPIPRRLIE